MVELVIFHVNVNNKIKIMIIIHIYLTIFQILNTQRRFGYACTTDGKSTISEQPYFFVYEKVRWQAKRDANIFGVRPAEIGVQYFRCKCFKKLIAAF